MTVAISLVEMQKIVLNIRFCDLLIPNEKKKKKSLQWVKIRMKIYNFIELFSKNLYVFQYVNKHVLQSDLFRGLSQ